MANGRNPGESFYGPAKRNFLEKLQKLCYYHILLRGVKRQENEAQSRGLELFLSATSCPGCRGEEKGGDDDIGHLTWSLGKELVLLSFLFSGGGAAAVSPETI